MPRPAASSRVLNSDLAHLDAQQPLASLNFQARNVYGTLASRRGRPPGAEKGKITVMQPSPGVLPGQAHPDDEAPHRRQVPHIAPVNGRTMDIEDIKYNFTNYTATGALRSIMFNSVNPDAPILSTTFPDASTISVKLKEPLTYIHNYFASVRQLHRQHGDLPQGSGRRLRRRNQMIGHGPWYLSERTPSGRSSSSATSTTSRRSRTSRTTWRCRC